MRALLVGQLAILLALCGWIAAWPARTAAGLVVQTGGALLAALALAQVGLWLFPPWWAPYVAVGLLVAFALRQAARGTPDGPWPRSGRGRAGLAACSVLGLLSGGLILWLSVAARVPREGSPISLAAPLPAGRYLVVNGGGSQLINAHRASMDTTITRLRAWRGNAHAVDLVAIDARGFRARGLLPDDPAQYAIFGTPVLSPCSGTVLQAVDGLHDQAPPQYDRANPAGNHVILDCGGVHVVLAHLQRGSLRIAAGERVLTGAMLGAVGNSGGTDEPHLHIHAQRPGPPGAPMAGDPLPILLWGRYLVRGDRIAAPDGETP